MLLLVYYGANLFNLCPFPDSSALYVQNWVPIRPAVWPQFPSLLNCWSHKTTHNTALGIVGLIVWAYVHSQMNPQTCTKFGANRSSRLTASPDFWMCDPLTPPPDMPPGVLRGDLYLAYAHSKMNPQTWTKVGANRSSRLTASPDFWMFDPLKPPQVPPCVSQGNLFGVYPFPDEFAHVYQMCTKCDANRTSRLTYSPDFWICDPLTPPPMPRVNCI